MAASCLTARFLRRQNCCALSFGLQRSRSIHARSLDCLLSKKVSVAWQGGHQAALALMMPPATSLSFCSLVWIGMQLLVKKRLFFQKQAKIF